LTYQKAPSKEKLKAAQNEVFYLPKGTYTVNYLSEERRGFSLSLSEWIFSYIVLRLKNCK
jgi:hypothetical protein